jgi:hypothetical protein
MNFAHGHNDGSNIVEALRSLRKLCAEIASLLSSADNLMSHNGWTPMVGNVYGRLTYTLAEPKKWIQQDIFRLYRNPELKHLACFISVILDDTEKPDSITEPLLTAGFFDYGIGSEVGISEKHFDYSLVRWHLNMPDRNDKGVLTQIEHEPSLKETFKRVGTIGIPLLSITDALGLQRTIITPLLKGLNVP